MLRAGSSYCGEFCSFGGLAFGGSVRRYFDSGARRGVVGHSGEFFRAGCFFTGPKFLRGGLAFFRRSRF